jgi:hypothetical protein
MSKNAQKIAVSNVEDRIYDEIKKLVKWQKKLCWKNINIAFLKKLLQNKAI